MRLLWKLLDGLIRLRKGLGFHLSPMAIGYLWMTPAIFLVGILVVGMGYLLVYSVFRYHPEQFMIPAFTLENYGAFFTNPKILNIFGRTVGTSALVTVFALLLAYPYAYLLVRVQRGWLQKVLLIMLFLPFFTGEVVRAYAWLIILGRQGLVNSIITGVGLPAMDLIYNRFSVTVGLVQIMLPFAVLMLAPALTNVTLEMERAAMNLGAGKIRTLWYVVIPLSRPGVVAASVVVFTLSVTEYAVPAILGGGLYDFMANRIYQIFFHVLDFPQGAVYSLILVAAVSILIGAALVLGAWISRRQDLSGRALEAPGK
jgi:putative spermidine/putrescine transport system permease protein